MNKSCLACGSGFVNVEIGHYSECPNCGSYRYISDRNAEIDNKEYFEEAELYNVKQVKSLKYLFRLFRIFFSLVSMSFWRSKFNELKIQYLSSKKKKILEIGFGNGRWLYRHLRKGKDAFGIDLSEEAVKEFQRKYPQFKARVQEATNPSGKYDLIYANAIFEHLDDPDRFLGEIQNSLNEGGVLVLGIPTVNSGHATLSIDDDINFWKPCHRAIYTMHGISELMNRNGFEVVVNASDDLLVYRLLNTMLKKGVSDVHKYRTPFYDYNGINNFIFFSKCLFSTPFLHSKSIWSKMLLKKK